MAARKIAVAKAGAEGSEDTATTLTRVGNVKNTSARLIIIGDEHFVPGVERFVDDADLFALCEEFETLKCTENGDE